MSAPGFELILASASPRRRELVALLGIPFRVVPSLYDEPPAPGVPVPLAELVTSLAVAKATEVASRLNTGWVLGADTLVSLDEDVGVPLGKPTDRSDAARMLRLLSGRSHFVYTGVALLAPARAGELAQPVTSVTRTRVWFRDLADAMIADYIDTGEPMDKAGAYGAQGFAAPFIERFDGDYYNVVGLPLCDVGRLLERCGMDWYKWRETASARTS